MSKNKMKKLGAYISILYMLTKSFREKPTTYVSRVKKTKSGVKNCFSQDILLSFLHKPQKYQFSPKLDVHTYNVEMYMSNVCLIFFHVGSL